MNNSEQDSNSTPLKATPCRLLLVEDNCIALKMVQLLAEQARCQYMSAENSETALQMIFSSSFDMIITDLGLPDFSGYDLTIKIRHWERKIQRAPLPIIGLTAQTIELARPRAFLAGMDELLAKPLRLNDLKKLLARYSL